jgi:thioester reductase-like protein
MIVFITGATGFLGGELVVNLSKQKEITKIYCLIRARDHQEAILRLKKIFSFHNDFLDTNKIIPVLGDLYDEQLTEKLIQKKELKEINVIVHSAANTSFSKIFDDVVMKANVHGLNKILLWAKQLDQLNTFLYIGTATICGKDIKNRLIHEEESPNLNANHLVKYTYTKMQGELLLRTHLPEEKILIARPSIIMGDSRTLTPRSPVILWALATVNALRLCTFNANATIDVISVDYAANAIVKLLFAKRKHNVYHISAGQNSSTTPAKVFNAIETQFNQLPTFKFVHKSLLDQMKKWAKGSLNLNEELYQHSDYLNYWEETFKDKKNLRIILAGLEPYIEFIELGQVFDNTRLLEDVDIAASQPVHEYIINSIGYLKKINVLEGAIDS